ncbi:VOC family protein [Branchiibius cervicis]|uniref:VOC family protein n=1 Tax=Branchiibius cervicis TaxID=908252 RepID=A0ABW2AYI8_9MICO
MTTRDTNWPAGYPCWIDISFDTEHRRLHHAATFYGELFGWRVEEGDEQYGGYRMCFKNDAAVAGLAPKMDPQQPSVWLLYLASDDAAATTAAVRQYGGQVIVEPMDVGNLGTMSVCVDPQGGVFGVWQGKEHHGFELIDEPGSVGWSDLLTHDGTAAQEFYAAVFGYTYREADADGYFFIEKDGQVVGGLHQAPQDVPVGWLVHFNVASRDASAQIAQELDGEIIMTLDTVAGPEATIQGLGGELFNLVEPTTNFTL